MLRGDLKLISDNFHQKYLMLHWHEAKAKSVQQFIAGFSSKQNFMAFSL